MKKNRGFTLIELMVAVALIGILSTVGIFNFKRFRNKAKQTEAKITLAAIYQLEIGYRVESNTFTQCLTQIGFSPSVGPRYYTIGFNPGKAGSISSMYKGVACNTTGLTWNMPITSSDVIFSANMSSSSLHPNNASFALATVPLPDLTTFKAMAIANLNGTALDVWSIDDEKLLQNTTPAL